MNKDELIEKFRSMRQFFDNLRLKFNCLVNKKIHRFLELNDVKNNSIHNNSQYAVCLMLEIGILLPKLF